MKSKIGGIVLLLICGLSSCKTDQKPAAVLEKEKFAEVLVDMYVAEARLAGISIIPDSSSTLFRPFRESLFKKKDVTDSVMKITYRYYVDHPIELEEVYDIAIDTLSLREQRAGINPQAVRPIN